MPREYEKKATRKKGLDEPLVSGAATGNVFVLGNLDEKYKIFCVDLPLRLHVHFAQEKDLELPLTSLPAKNQVPSGEKNSCLSDLGSMDSRQRNK